MPAICEVGRAPDGVPAHLPPVETLPPVPSFPELFVLLRGGLLLPGLPSPLGAIRSSSCSSFRSSGFMYSSLWLSGSFPRWVVIKRRPGSPAPESRVSGCGPAPARVCACPTDVRRTGSIRASREASRLVCAMDLGLDRTAMGAFVEHRPFEYQFVPSGGRDAGWHPVGA